MAITFAGYEITVILRDRGNKPFRKVFYPSPALVTTDAEATTAAAAAASSLDVVSGLSVQGYTIGKRYLEEDPLTLPQISGYDKASIVVQLEDPAKTATLFIPGAANGIYQATTGSQSNVVDINDADLITYVGLFKDTGYFLISDGEHVAATNAIISGQRIHQKSTNN